MKQKQTPIACSIKGVLSKCYQKYVYQSNKNWALSPAEPSKDSKASPHHLGRFIFLYIYI